MRPLKNCEPVKTVERIRQILKGLDIAVFEQYWSSTGGRFHSCTVQVEGLPDLVSHGKGTSKHLALASALAELMERVQNLKIFFSRVGVSDEQVLCTFADTTRFRGMCQLLAANPDSAVPDARELCQLLAIPSKIPLIGAEFYDVMNATRVILPYLIMLNGSGSNGMCAGNDPAEALVQGICEILEREALKRIFAEHVVPPVFPETVIKNLECYEDIRPLETLGFSVQVRDCSLDCDFPVVGVMVVDRKTGRYRFKLGAHPVFHFALQRAISELFQGIDPGSFGTCSQELSPAGEINGSVSPSGTEQVDWFARSTEFEAQLRTGSGRLPAAFFWGTPSYCCRHRAAFRESSSYEEDLSILIGILHRRGCSLYVRDVSFLGFPTYYVYVPGYSAVFDQWPWGGLSRKQRLASFVESRGSSKSLASVFSSLDNAASDDIDDIIRYLDLHCRSIESDWRDRNLWLEMLYHCRLAVRPTWTPEYLLGLLYFRTGRPDEAYYWMTQNIVKEKLRRESAAQVFVYRDLSYLLSTGNPPSEAIQRLSSHYSETVLDAVRRQIEGNATLFENFPVPTFSSYQHAATLQRVFEAVSQSISSRPVSHDAVADLLARCSRLDETAPATNRH